ncbi:hypothetical protein Ddye_004417 [Dipteronia dyeriana]|uniref:Uncharacterized protein n=1 Tax=Dipteronia dyeriana TaxID=168575 RepID=A0AAD9XW02_9ROSI|nr:hypothetical protein Ddye_004417 [Dipteronia dyeriana]
MAPNNLIKFWVCVTLVLLTLSSRSESRPLEANPESKSLTKIWRQLVEISREVKVKPATEETVHSFYYDSKRLSPGGPDPKHHSRNLS